MRVSLAALVPLLLANATAAGAAPPSAAATRDVQCFALFSFGAGVTADPQQKMAGALAVAYFYGKIRTHSPGLNVAGALLEEIRNLRGSDAKAVGVACETEFKQMGADLQAIAGEVRSAAPQPSGN